MTAKPVVVATDGSGESVRAVEWAAREAAVCRVPLRIVSAASLPKMVVLQLQPERDAVLGYVREERDRALAAAVARAARLAPGLLIDTDPVEGPAARAVTQSGSGALMLVVGFRGIGAFAAMMLGSVARYTADHALHRGRLACAVRAQDPEDLALVHRERHVIDGHDLAVGLAEARDLDRGRRPALSHACGRFASARDHAHRHPLPGIQVQRLCPGASKAEAKVLAAPDS